MIPPGAHERPAAAHEPLGSPADSGGGEYVVHRGSPPPSGLVVYRVRGLHVATPENWEGFFLPRETQFSGARVHLGPF